MMLEIIKDLHLEKWATVIVLIILLWKFVLKSAFDTWLKNKLEMQKQEVGNALMIQKELVVKQAEFEKVKLERALPLLEIINNAISEHGMMFNSYIHAIFNKFSIKEEIENQRLEQDIIFIKSLSNVAIYLPIEFRELLYRIRKVISCSWSDPLVIHRVLHRLGNLPEALSAAQKMYSNLKDCYYSMCNKYIGAEKDYVSYEDILNSYDLDKNANTTNSDPTNQLAWKFLLFHEYYGSSEIMQVQEDFEKFNKETAKK